MRKNKKDDKENFDLYEFNNTFDKKFYNNFTYNKELDQEGLVKSLTKLRTRFSFSSHVIMTSFTEFILRNVLEKTLVTCLDNNRSILKLEHLISNEENWECKNIYNLIKLLPCWSDMYDYNNNMISWRVDKDRKNKPMPEYPSYLEDCKGFVFYIGETCKWLKKNLHNKNLPPRSISISKPLKLWVSCILYQIVMKLVIL